MEIKGTAVIAIRDFVKANYADKYNDWMQSLPENVKMIYSGVIDSSNRYSLGVVIFVTRYFSISNYFLFEYYFGTLVR